MDKLSAVAANFSTFNVEALIVGLVCLAVLVSVAAREPSASPARSSRCSQESPW
ncbi:MAG: hypothetical protein ACLTSX_09325 [Collinsella sp.]